ncbi:Photosystem II protein [Actinidia chinensis var. chinensis]|uniref:Photosystem II protein n=1 Tax=Actinidia chinensis var. chinensis TaxID=1590841 RepID=A0A2R6P843_ACTCC|nr:Photosystem II protein [Actinidia chinensis var. chinensis]
MASMTMPASFLGSSTAAISKTTISRHRQVAVVAKATSNVNESVSFKTENKEERGSSGGRRELVFAAAAAAMWSAARVAGAVEPKKGTPEAKKKYAPVCVTMPTARICHK